MDAKRCDRCGTFYTNLVSFPIVELYSSEGNEKQINVLGNAVYSADLCPDCWESLGNWWKGPVFYKGE